MNGCRERCFAMGWSKTISNQVIIDCLTQCRRTHGWWPRIVRWFQNLGTGDDFGSARDL